MTATHFYAKKQYPKLHNTMITILFHAYFSTSNGSNSEKRFFPDMCSTSNWSASFGLKAMKFWKESLAPFPRKSQICARQADHNPIFSVIRPFQLEFSTQIGCHCLKWNREFIIILKWFFLWERLTDFYVFKLFFSLMSSGTEAF